MTTSVGAESKRQQPDGMPGDAGHAAFWSATALLIGLSLSALAAHLHWRLETEQTRAGLMRVAERSVDALEQQMLSCALLVRALQTLFVSSERVSEQEFAAAFDSIGPRRVFPSLVAMAYSERRPPLAPGGDDRYITTMVAPRAGNEAVLGLDVNSQPANRGAVERALETNEPGMSAPFRLVQSARNGAADGLVIRLPVYAGTGVPDDPQLRRERAVGSLAVSFRIDSLLASAFPPAVQGSFAVRVADVTDAEPLPLYASADASWHSGERYRYDRDIAFGGRRWHVDLVPLPRAVEASWLPWLTFGTGALASVLLALVVWQFAATRSAALRMARGLSSRYRESESRFRALNELLPTGVLLVRRRDDRIVYINRTGRALLEIEDGDTGNRRLAEFLPDIDVAGRGESARRPLGSGGVQARSARGHRLWVSCALAEIELEGEDHQLVAIDDISQARELTERLAYQATHDALTDLVNRNEFESRLAQVLSAPAPADGRRAALLYLDLDQFKIINDTSGHYAGDQLLAHLAIILGGCIGPRDTLARLGGDEFGVLLADVDAAQATTVAERIREAVDAFVFTWEDKNFQVSVSVGVVPLGDGRLALRKALSLADAACYLAKEHGRNRVHVYSEDDTATPQRLGEMEWVNRLRRALAEDAFTLHFQEIRAISPPPRGGEIAGDGTFRPERGPHIELLIRLPDAGQVIAPGAFLPAAERYQLMPQIDRWVLRTALARFDRLHPDGASVGLCSVNLSGTTLDDETFPDFVIEQLHQHRVRADRLCFEITETAAVGNLASASRFIARLREVGCQFALDDFGVGMSSFGYLKNLAVDYVKIDGSFIGGLERDALSYSIVRAVTEIAHQTGARVVAEFVNSERTLALLREIGVDYVQGFGVHQPEPVGRSTATAWLGQ